MKRKKQKKVELLIAWTVLIIAVLAIIGVIAFLFIKVKDPATAKVAAFWKDINTVETVPEEVETDVADENKSSADADKSDVDKNAEVEAGKDEALGVADLDNIFSDEVSATDGTEITSQSLFSEEIESEAAKLVADMTLDQKICQLFFVVPEALTGVDKATAAGDMTRTALEKYPVGGILFFAQNIEGPEQLKLMTSNYQKYSEEITGLPLFLATDEEGGQVARIARNENFEIENEPPMAEIGETGDVTQALASGEKIGAYLNEYGINMDFAPSADVVEEGSENMVGNRSFGSDATLVADMSQAFTEGLHKSNVLAVPKHFPGHGAVEGDTHDDIAVTDKDWSELEAYYLVPFQHLIDEGLKCLMVSHISVPAVTGDDIPVSMSGIVLTEKLRLSMGYKGLIITDAMNMGAPVKNYDSTEAVIEALKAGVDMVLMPKSLEEAVEGVKKAVEDGVLSEDRITESVIRIVETKLYLNQN